MWYDRMWERAVTGGSSWCETIVGHSTQSDFRMNVGMDRRAQEDLEIGLGQVATLDRVQRKAALCRRAKLGMNIRCAIMLTRA